MNSKHTDLAEQKSIRNKLKGDLFIDDSDITISESSGSSSSMTEAQKFTEKIHKSIE